MPKNWDITLRKLVRAQPQAFLKFVLSDAQFVRQLPDKHGDIQLEMDGLFLAEEGSENVLVNVELQAYYDPKMAERLLRYNVLLRTEYNVPVRSFAIHLLDDTELPASPLIWTVPGKEKVLEFDYDVIELSRIMPEDILSFGLRGLYPLLPLTKGGARREVVERMFGELGETGRTDLELVGFTLASYVFARLNIDEEDWLIRRFHKMHDFLHDSPIYQLILQEGREEGIQQARQQAIQEGIEQGIQQGLAQGQRQALRDAIIAITLERFPDLIDLAERKTERVQRSIILQQIVLKLSVVKTAEEARQYLLKINENVENR